MSSLKELKRHFHRLSFPNHLAIYDEIVGAAVSACRLPTDEEIFWRIHLKERRYHLLVERADEYSSQTYEEPEEHFRRHQLAALVRKYPFTPAESGLKPQEAALATFKDSERLCKETNERFRDHRAGRFLFSADLEKYTSRMIAWIYYVLGPKPNLQEIYAECSFTPGAAIGVHGNATNQARKLMASDWTVTPSALPYALGAMWKNHHIRELVLKDRGEHGTSYTKHIDIACYDANVYDSLVRARAKAVPANKVTFVPKTAKTERSIAVEPLLNSFLQKGVDVVMRRRLAQKAKVDLSDQGRNARLARLGSMQSHNPYCTIDLSSASDTLAKEVVRELLPPEWFELLNELRSHAGVVEGEVIHYEKFASMGNGFCFPLESLIFAAILHAAQLDVPAEEDKTFSVYGDDLIVREGVAEVALMLLRHFGFIPNPRKTFTSGPFRESCGKDWHGGVNVRPIYLTKRLDSLGVLMSFHNESLRREKRVIDFFGRIRNILFWMVPYEVRLVSHRDPSQGESLFADAVPEVWVDPPADSAFWVKSMDLVMSAKYNVYCPFEQRWRIAVLQQEASADDLACNTAKVFGILCMIGALCGGSPHAPYTLRYQTSAKARLL